MPVKIFFCYAHEDEALLNKLKSHLRSLQRQDLIDVWHDRNISAGTNWEHEINTHLNEAQIILLLVSPDFMNSDYCYSFEMKRALERHERGEVSVIHVILRPTDWAGTPLEQLQVLPTDAKPVTKWRDRDEAFLDIARGIGDVARALLSQKGKTQATLRGTTIEKVPLNSEVLSPDQREEDMVKVPLFPNTATEQVHQLAQQQLTTVTHNNPDAHPQSRPLLPELILSQERQDGFHIKHQQTHRKRLYQYVFVGLTVLSIVFLISSSWWYSVLFQSRTASQPLTKQNNSENSPLEISFKAIESRFWVILGNPAQYTLKDLPEQDIGGLYTDGHLSAPLYHLYFELRNLSTEQYSDIIIKEIKLKILQIRPLPQRPVPLWMDDEAFHHESPHIYEALYLGTGSGSIPADYVKSDYVTNNPGTVTISPEETERVEVHIISHREVDILFSVQVTYFFAAESLPRTLTLAPTFEVIFADKSSTSLYQLHEGHFVQSS